MIFPQVRILGAMRKMHIFLDGRCGNEERYLKAFLTIFFPNG